jgi:hypothetical protein
MIRLYARRNEAGLGAVFVYTILVPGHEPFVTDRESHAAAHLDALGAEEPEHLLEQVQQWREIEIAPTKE